MQKRTNKITNIFAAVFIAAIFAIFTTSANAQEAELKFDAALQADFTVGMGGDAQALTRAFERADKILAKNPKDAETLVWHGAATLAQSGKEFQTGKYQEGWKMWQKGLGEMNQAADFAPNNFTVRFVRGSTFLNAAKHFPDPATSKDLREKGVADYEKVLSLTDAESVKLAETRKHKIYQSLIDAYDKLGDKTKADASRAELAKLGK